MTKKENDSFLSFLRIFRETGNASHAASESGWTDQSDSPSPTIDLSTIPEDHHDYYDYYRLTIPAYLKQYIENATAPLTQGEIDNLELAMEKHHHVNPSTHYVGYDPEERVFNFFIRP